MSLIVHKAIKTRIRARGLSCGAKSVEEFDNILASIVDKACERAKQNKRKTVMEQDV